MVVKPKELLSNSLIKLYAVIDRETVRYAADRGERIVVDLSAAVVSREEAKP